MKIVWFSLCFALIYANFTDYDVESTTITDAEYGDEEYGLPRLDIKLVGEYPAIIKPGTQVSFICEIIGAQGEVWFLRYERNITDSVNDSNSSRILTVELNNRNDSGNYTCMARTREGIFLNETFSVAVTESTTITDEEYEAEEYGDEEYGDEEYGDEEYGLPRLDITLVGEYPTIIEPGTQVSFICEIIGAQGEVWLLHNERNITDFVNNSNSSRILTIELNSRNDSGNYTCMARTREGIFLNETFSVTVTENDGIRAEQLIYRSIVNDSVTLICHVQGTSLSNFTWERADKPEYSNLLTNHSSISYLNDTNVVMALHFKSVKRTDHGNYVCSAKNSRITIRSYSILAVADLPQISIDYIEAVGMDRVYVKFTLDNGIDTEKAMFIYYVKYGTSRWQYCNDYMYVEEDAYILKGLEPATSYQFRIMVTNSVGNSTPTYSKWVTTFEYEPKFTPNVSIIATTLHSISIQWTAPPAKLRDYVHYYEVKVTYGNDSELLNGLSTPKTEKTFQNLTSLTNYRFKVAACNQYTIRCGNWSIERETITIDRDPKFIPNVSVEATTLQSIMIEWTIPAPELKDRVHQYKLMATHQDEKLGPIYVAKTVNSYIFENLQPRASYLLKVAACSDYRTQCGDWSAEKEVLTVDKVGKEAQNAIWPSVIVAIVLLVVMTIWMAIRKHHEKVSREKFMEATLNRFNLGALAYLNPELNIGDQAEVLPYNQKWEYPPELLRLDKVLGSGAFGIVRKANAKSIRRPEKTTTVAVKMVRTAARLSYVTALSRELKILSHLGEHLNIVNLLGACTKNISYGELFVIVEFCRFGNLHDYLLRGREDFVNEFDACVESLAPATSCSTSRVDYAKNNRVTIASYNSCPTADPSDTEVPIDNHQSEINFVEPSWPSKYRGDYTDQNLEPICTRDLLCWAWQVSRGMKYLGIKRILHGDLAARNILLADRNVVKICDFGLAKALYKSDYCNNEEQGPLPIKWMAIESLKDRVFSIKSDIWSYGIVLWEFFTLAETPYPDIKPEIVYQKLADGFRMTKPKYATEDIYHMMLECWNADPSKRPSFDIFEDSFSDLLDESVKMDHHEISAQYDELNTETLGHDRSYYLTIIPEEDAADEIKSTLERD